MKHWTYWLLGIVLALALGLACNLSSRAHLATQPQSTNASLLLVGLGGTRGILSEILWWRISDLQRKGRNAEVYPLTQLLTELDPSTPNVAVFNAWNCAYNIASTYSHADERWTWMKRGHAILAEALERYPKDENALREMVAFWQLKFYGDIDPFQYTYHQRVAEIPMEPFVRQALQHQGLPENPHIPALRLYGWAHHAGFHQEKRFALMRLLEATPNQTYFHRHFAEAYQTACRHERISTIEAKNYQAVAQKRLQDFPNDPYLIAILKELP